MCFTIVLVCISFFVMPLPGNFLEPEAASAAYTQPLVHDPSRLDLPAALPGALMRGPNERSLGQGRGY